MSRSPLILRSQATSITEKGNTVKHLTKTFLAVAVVFFSLRSLAVDFDTESYDSEVTNYLLEVHERLSKNEISEEGFKKYYMQIVNSPNAETLAEVTLQMFNDAKTQGHHLNDQNFVVFLHRVVLGQFSMQRNYSRDSINADTEKLKKGQVKQAELLKNYLTTEMGQDRMAELVAGDIQQERFNDYKLTSNH